MKAGVTAALIDIDPRTTNLMATSGFTLILIEPLLTLREIAHEAPKK